TASSLARSIGWPNSTANSVTSAPARVMISRIRRPNWPAITTTTRSPGSITDTAADSRAVRPEPGMTMTSACEVWNTWRSLRVTGSRISRSKCWSYWMIGGWLMAWTTGHGSSVGPGIISVARVWGTPQRIVGSMSGLLVWFHVGAPPRPTVWAVKPRSERSPLGAPGGLTHAAVNRRGEYPSAVRRSAKVSDGSDF